MRTPSSTIAMQLERPLWDSHSVLEYRMTELEEQVEKQTGYKRPAR
jgi:hypothetical protein